MSNCESFVLPCIEAEPNQVRDILRCLLHTVLFNRALGHVRPREVDCDLLDISYVCCDSRDVAQAVESGIHDFCTVMERKPPAHPVQVRLAFYEKRQKASWFGTADERMYWEQWHIPLVVLGPSEMLQRSVQLDEAGVRTGSLDRSSAGLAGGVRGSAAAPSPAQLGRTLAAALSYVSRCLNERRDHLPPVVSSNVLTYPFDITASTRDGRASFSLGSVKKMLMQTTPPPMLG